MIPPSRCARIVDNIGLPISGIKWPTATPAPIGAADADILITLNAAAKPKRRLT